MDTFHVVLFILTTIVVYKCVCFEDTHSVNPNQHEFGCTMTCRYAQMYYNHSDQNVTAGTVDCIIFETKDSCLIDVSDIILPWIKQKEE